jgi:Peptidase family C25
MAATPDGLYASDNRFGDVDGAGDGWPEIVVGRIPVLTEAELDAYVDKLARFEASSMSLWSDPIVMVADDDPWTRSPFDRQSESMASVVPATAPIERIYLGKLKAQEARTRVLSSLASGAALFNYVGHGGLDRMADETLLVTSDVAHLGNGDRAGIVSAFSCTINRFELPGFTSLGEALAIEPTGGAVAVWAPSGLSKDFEAFRLGGSFFTSLYRGDATLGDAILSAFRSYREGQGLPLMPTLYTLMGDPGLRLK